MRILHVIPQFPYFGGRTVVGGHASCLLTLALAQAEAGAAVTVLSYVQGRSGEQRIDDRVDLVSLFDEARPGTASFGLRFRRAAAAWTQPRQADFDLIHCHSGFADYFLVSGTLARRVDLPVLHTLYCPIPRSGGRWRLPMVHGLINRNAARLDAVCAMSENVAQSMRDYGMSDVLVVPPPVDTKRFHPATETAATRERLGLAPGDVAVLFVGNAKPQKNLSGTLRAFRLVRDAHPSARLVVTTELAQSSPDHRLAELRQEMIDLDLESSIIQKGVVDDMPALMQACDILVAPFMDSFGPSDYFMAVLEAMACGKPTVVSDVGGMSEVITEETGRLVDPGDDRGIADALDTLVADADLRRTVGARARSYTERHFDPRRIVERYGDVYSQLTSNSNMVTSR